MYNERMVETDTKKELLAKRAQRVVAPEKVYSLDTLSSNAEILAECGGQAALVFRAIVGSYWFSNPEEREQGFTLKQAFRAAIKLPDRQRQRATQALDKAGYIERLSRPGNKTRIRLTKKGEQALAVKPNDHRSSASRS